ncbi:MAG: serine hydrolase domain-containing protein [Akkermansiaceae bacterium]
MNVAGIEACFRNNFISKGELGASVSIWKHGEEVVSLHDGWRDRGQECAWTQDTLVPFYSMTKGLASATLLLVLEEAGYSPATPVRELWEKFPAEGNIGQLLSHQLGFAALDKRADVWNYEEVIDAIEQQSPNWPMASGHGYHPRTFGFLLEKLVRCLTGKPLGSVWRERIADPMKLDAWIGLPEQEFHRVATLYPGKQDKSDLQSGFYKELHTPESLVKRAFSSPAGLHSIREMNEPRAWQAGLPAMGGVGTARAVAQFYQIACGAIPFFSEHVRAWMQTALVSGQDKILCAPTAFSCGFQLDPLDASGRKIRHHYGHSRRAFGHPGAGGSHAFCDPDEGISFAYTMNQMELSPFPGPKSLDMIRALYRS